MNLTLLNNPISRIVLPKRPQIYPNSMANVRRIAEVNRIAGSDVSKYRSAGLLRLFGLFSELIKLVKTCPASLVIIRNQWRAFRVHEISG